MFCVYDVTGEVALAFDSRTGVDGAARLLQSKGFALERQGDHWQAIVPASVMLSTL